MIARMLTKSQRLIVSFGGWIIVVLALLVMLQSLSYDSFFALCLIGFLIIVELSGPFITKPKWRARVNLIIAAGVIVFVFIVLTKVLEIMA